MMKKLHRSARAIQGQIAAGFLVIMALSLFFVQVTVQMGQMATVRVETSNAADAGALSAASWIASGQNEAAMVAQKMWDAISMVQAIYLVPFCPDVGFGTTHEAYAFNLASSLKQHKDPDTLEDLPSELAGYGLNTYYHEVANHAMNAGFMVGRREFLTAAINNMMTRFQDGETYSGDPFIMGAEGTSYEGDFPTEIADAQKFLYQSRVNVNRADLSWNNGVPVSSPNHHTHRPQFRIRHEPTTDPPQMKMDDMRFTYYVYRPAEKPTKTRFVDFGTPSGAIPGGKECAFDAVGIINNMDGPYVDLTRARGADGELVIANNENHNPLRMSATGQKEWDFDLAGNGTPGSGVIPGLVVGGTDTNNSVVVGDCPQVCGMKHFNYWYEDIQPGGVDNTPGTVNVMVAHEVKAGGGGESIIPMFGAIQNWVDRFQNVASDSTAEFTAASMDPPIPDAKARLTETR